MGVNILKLCTSENVLILPTCFICSLSGKETRLEIILPLNSKALLQYFSTSTTAADKFEAFLIPDPLM